MLASWLRVRVGTFPGQRSVMALLIGLGLVTVATGQVPEAAPPASTLLPGAEEGFVDSGGVKIHYVSLGRPEDPLLVMIHGFPDFWYSWRAQMPALAKRFHVVAIDQRGYNLSGQPEGVANYTIDKLVGDLVAVVKHFGARQGGDRGTRLGRAGGLDVRHDSPRADRPADRAQPAASARTHARAGDQPQAAEE